MLYRAYGLTLASVLPLPELAPAPAPGTPDLSIELATTPDDEASWTALPPPDEDGPWLTIAQRPGAYRLRFEDGGTFVVSDGGRRITIEAGPPGARDTLRHLLIDQVIPLALSHMGHVVLHAGSVVVNDAGRGLAVAFIGPAGAGKSTLTASLAGAGCALLADDALVVAAVGAELLATPAYPGVRLWPEMAALAGGSPDIAHPRVAEYTDKRRVGLTAGWRFAEVQVPLGRVYLLDERECDRVSVERVGPRDAIVLLLSHMYVLDVSDRVRLAAQFARVCAASPAVEVRRLSYPRALEYLPAVHTALLDDVRHS